MVKRRKTNREENFYKAKFIWPEEFALILKEYPPIFPCFTVNILFDEIMMTADRVETTFSFLKIS